MQRDGNTLIKVDSDDSASWLANKVNRVEVCSIIGDKVAFKSRNFNVLAFNVPLNLDTRDEVHLAEINKTNGLEDNTISAIHWAKHPLSRSPNQRSAHLVLLCTNPEAANMAITGGLIICNKKCHVERIKREPIRCLKCQGWNHIARECPKCTAPAATAQENTKQLTALNPAA
jgi:hypothetical protein